MNKLSFLSKSFLILFVSLLQLSFTTKISASAGLLGEPVKSKKVKYSNAVHSFMEGKVLGDLVQVSEDGLIYFRENIFPENFTKNDFGHLEEGLKKINQRIDSGRIQRFQKEDKRLNTAARWGCCECPDCPCDNLMKECCEDCFLFFFCLKYSTC